MVLNDEHTDRKYVLFFLLGWGKYRSYVFDVILLFKVIIGGGGVIIGCIFGFSLSVPKRKSSYCDY